MQKRAIYWAVGIAIVLIVGFLIYFNIGDREEEILNSSGTQIANPASVYCIRQGGQNDINTGMCTLPDGTKCDEWALFRGMCGNLSANGCATDADCVPADCCHPNSCTSVKNAPKCDKTACTMNCEAGTLDCAQGSCACIDGGCTALLKT